MFRDLFRINPKKKQPEEKEQNFTLEKVSTTAGTREVKTVSIKLEDTQETEIDFQNKNEIEYIKQEIFDKIHIVVDEYGGTEKWGADIEKLLKADVLRFFTNSVGIEFVPIPAGEFIMGSKENNDEQPVHKVTIRNPFYLSKYPITQKQWEKVTGSTPSRFKGDDVPVECVSWNDIQEFVKKLNQMEGTDKYCLLSEAEWEYACRAGTITRFCFGGNESELGNYGWYSSNSGNKTHPVGQKNPNPWGLYDMHGNVWEWCQDRWHINYEGAPSDGSAWESGTNSDRVLRGGSWFDDAKSCRSAYRNWHVPGDRLDNISFRLMRKL